VSEKSENLSFQTQTLFELSQKTKGGQITPPPKKKGGQIPPPPHPAKYG